MATLSQIRGALYGHALGDAFGAPTEFLSVSQILEKWPPHGPQEPYGMPQVTPTPPLSTTQFDPTSGRAEPEGGWICVTDDTQMGLALGHALFQVSPTRWNVTNLEAPVRRAFLDWYHDPNNNRAPGNTCLSGCDGLEQGLPWYEATIHGSKGCGANMRVVPIGLLAELDDFPSQARAGLAQWQAALTHGHPTGLAAADLTAYTLMLLLQKSQPTHLVSRLLEYAQSQQTVYHEAWLGPLWQRPGMDSPTTFIQRGWDECIALLHRLNEAQHAPDKTQDPCLWTGAGWVADECFATGLLAFLWHVNEPTLALQRAAVTSGDSDSIASLTGAFVGAYHGNDAWPIEWIQRLEYNDALDLLAQKIAQQHKG